MRRAAYVPAEGQNAAARPSARCSRFDARSPRRCERWLEALGQGLGASHKPPSLETPSCCLFDRAFLRSTARSQVELPRSEQDCSHGHGTDQSELWCCCRPQLQLVSGLSHLPFERGVGGTGPGQLDHLPIPFPFHPERFHSHSIPSAIPFPFHFPSPVQVCASAHDNLIPARSGRETHLSPAWEPRARSSGSLNKQFDR